MNDPVDHAVRARGVRAARGLEPFDVLLCGGTVVDVGTGELRRADIGLVGPLIVSVHGAGERTDAMEVVDCAGRWLVPGLIDMHVHFESSMLTPAGYAAAVCPRGTTTVFCDPHELANVAGVAGVRYAVDASRDLPVRFIVQAPSCVPPQPGLELSGADLFGPDVEEMLSWPEVGGLAEVMDMLGVLGADDRMVGVVRAGLDRGTIICGHASGLTGAALQAYLAAGIDSDHEIFSQPDVMERIRAGMTVELRGMIEQLLPGIIAELQAMPEFPTHLVACTDDLFAMTLVEDGGVDHLVRRLIAAGLPPARAFRVATYNAAYRLRRNDLGLLAAGRQADIVVLSSLEDVTAEAVYRAGRLVATDGEIVVPCAEPPSSPPLHTVHLGPLAPADMVLRLDLPDGGVRLRVIDGVIATSWGTVDTIVAGGVVDIPPGHILQAVAHRHGRASREVHLALASGWGDDWTGAIATTVSHDTHNLVVFGRDPVSMATAANAVIVSDGGVAVARGTEVLAAIELPIAGILSPLGPDELAPIQRAATAAALAVGLPPGQLTQPLLQVMASSLACLPGPHLTDVGLIDGSTGERIAGALADA
jgi:adenine deaminase